jgi:hypothetical protein
MATTTEGTSAAAEAKPDKNEKYFYFVDGEKFDSDSEFATGAIIKSRLAEAKRSYALYLEGHGNDPDTLINDDTSIDLQKEKDQNGFTPYRPPALAVHDSGPRAVRDSSKL